MPKDDHAASPQASLSEGDIQRVLYWRYGVGRDYSMPNVHIFCNESDFVTITKAGYVDEYEIKISRSDFLADRKKHRHKAYEYLSPWNWREGWSGNETHIYPNARYPNRFWYVTPVGLVAESDLPDFAGLIEITDNRFVNVIRKAPQLHKEKADPTIATWILRAGYFRFTRRWADDYSSPDD